MSWGFASHAGRGDSREPFFASAPTRDGGGASREASEGKAPTAAGAPRPADPTAPKELFGPKDRPARRTPRPEIRAAKDRASLELSRGSFSRAFAAFVELCSAEPLDGQWPLKAGDALRRLNRLEEAVSFYRRAALTFHVQGFLDRATAVARIVADLSGDDSLLRKLDPPTRGAARAARPAPGTTPEPAAPASAPSTRSSSGDAR